MQTVLHPTPENRQSVPSRGLATTNIRWLCQRSQQDSSLWGLSPNSSEWIVQGKLYDLSAFIEKHPGGKHWIELTRGQNITEEFITHHLDLAKAQKILEKYFVRELDNTVPPDRFSFSQEGLYMEIKRRMLSKYTIQELQDSHKTKLIGLFLFLCWLTAFSIAGIYHSLLGCLLCGYLTLAVTGVAHNFVHMKPSLFKYFYLTTGFSPREWEIMHCISHHHYTNTLLDYELQAFEPIVYFIKSLPENSLALLIVAELLYLFLTPVNILLRLLVVPLFTMCLPEWQYLLPLCQIPVLYLLNDYNFKQALLYFLLIHCFFSFVFAKVTFGGHRVQNLWSDGEQQIRDFGEHALKTSNDIHPEVRGGLLSFLFFSGFNIHVAHHLFPTIDNQHLWKVNQILETVCKERGLHKNQKSLASAIVSVYQNCFGKKVWSAGKQQGKQKKKRT